MSNYKEDAANGIFALSIKFEARIGKIAIEGAVANPAMALAMLEIAKKEYELQWNMQRMAELQIEAQNQAAVQQLVGNGKIHLK